MRAGFPCCKRTHCLRELKVSSRGISCHATPDGCVRCKERFLESFPFVTHFHSLQIDSDCYLISFRVAPPLVASSSTINIRLLHNLGQRHVSDGNSAKKYARSLMNLQSPITKSFCLRLSSLNISSLRPYMPSPHSSAFCCIKFSPSLMARDKFLY